MKVTQEHNLSTRSSAGSATPETANLAVALSPRPQQLLGPGKTRRLPPPRDGRNGQRVTTRGVTRPHSQQLQAIPTTGEVLRDGSFLELIRDPHRSASELLLHWAEGKTTIAPEFEFDGCRYTPTCAAGPIQHLPSTPAPYSSTEALFNEVADFIAKYSGLDQEEAALLTFVCFASFFCDCSSMAPCLLLFGALVQAVSILRVLGCACRHPVLSAGSSVRGLPAELRPTRLICQADARVDKQLAALQFSGFRVPDHGLRQVSGASVIYAGDTELKSPFAELCLQLRVSSTGGSFGLQEEELEIVRINRLQNQLLMYRLKNYSNVKASQFDVPEFSEATREVARTLGRCIVGAPELQSRLTTLLRPRDDAERTESASKLEAVILEALLVCCHERKASVHVGEIATLANGILSRSGEPVELSPKQTGGKMKRLGFRTTKLDSGGRGIYLLSEQCARIHELGRAFSVPALVAGLPGCPYCRKS